MRTSAYFFNASAGATPAQLAQPAFEAVFRQNFDAPGFALLDLGAKSSPRAIREFMVGLKRELSELTSASLRKSLQYLSMGRFDQQTTTKFHLDGAPDESVLILGYEPTPIQSSLFIADYAGCAHAKGLTPREFLDQYNPMFTAGAELLQNYVTELHPFNPSRYMLLLINNSSAAYGAGLQGVMHQAAVPAPDPARQRIVNSTMTYLSAAQHEPIDLASQQHFIESDRVSPRLA